MDRRPRTDRGPSRLCKASGKTSRMASPSRGIGPPPVKLPGAARDTNERLGDPLPPHTLWLQCPVRVRRQRQTIRCTTYSTTEDGRPSSSRSIGMTPKHSRLFICASPTPHTERRRAKSAVADLALLSRACRGRIKIAHGRSGTTNLYPSVPRRVRCTSSGEGSPVLQGSGVRRCTISVQHNNNMCRDALLLRIPDTATRKILHCSRGASVL